MIVDECALSESGFVVVRQVLSAEECDRIAEVAIVESSTRESMAHSDTMWRLRTDPRIIHIFEQIWKTVDLVCSFDGMTIRQAGDIDAFVLDWHVDQDSRHGAGRCCVQGVLALSESSHVTGCTAFLTGSHKCHEALCEKYEDTCCEWEAFDVSASDPLLANCTEAVPALQKGDVLLWDSRCVHRVLYPDNPRESCRVVAYICMLPTHMTDADTRARRKRAYEQGVATTHWPSYVLDRGDARTDAHEWCDACDQTRALVMGNNRPRMSERRRQERSGVFS